MNDGVPEKILLIRLSSIGDIVLTTPLIRRLRALFPHAQIDFVVKEAFAELVRHHPALNTVYTLPARADFASLRAMREKLQQKNYSAVLDLHKNFRSLYLARGLGQGYKKRLQKYGFRRFLLVKTGWNLYKEIVPVYRRYLDVAAGLGIDDDGQGTELFWPDEAEAGLPQFAVEFLNAGDFVALAPGAGFATKRWPVQRFAEVARAVIASGKRCCILGSHAEQELAAEIVRAEPGCSDFTGKLSLLQSAVILSKAKRLVTNDSGLMHIAEAVGTPVVALFGSTVRELGFAPILEQSAIIENNSIDCRPCSHVGRDTCPKGHFLCMNSLDVRQVLGALQGL